MTVWCTRAPQAFGRHYRPAARFGIRKHRDRPLRPDRLITQQARFRIGSPSVLRRIRAPHYASTNPTSFSPIKYPDKYSAIAKARISRAVATPTFAEAEDAHL